MFTIGAVLETERDSEVDESAVFGTEIHLEDSEFKMLENVGLDTILEKNRNKKTELLLFNHT